MPRILFLTEGTTIPASRFRVGQFIPYFQERDIECVVRPGYGDLYNQVTTSALGNLYKAAAKLRQFARCFDVGSFDAVFFQRPLIPYTPWPQLVLDSLNNRTIFDVDDAIFFDNEGDIHPRRMKTFQTIVERVRKVICGNEFLADYAASPEKTTIIPTVIDCDRYTPSSPPENVPGTNITIGWMGTSSNFYSLKPIIPVIRQILEQHDSVRFRIVSNAAFPYLREQSNVEEIRWSAETEINLLRSFDIGLMPLANHPRCMGKCGFKMIQYMAVGTPVVASPVGANVEIFEGSSAGFLADEPARWYKALNELIEDETQRQMYGKSAREHVVANYSIRSVIDDYVELFEQVAST